MLFELLFLVLCIGTLGVLAVVLVQFFSGARVHAGRLLLALVGTWVGYLAVVAVVSATTPQRIVAFGQDQCFDDMCFSVVREETAAQIGPVGQTVRAQGLFHIVMVKVSNHARGRTEREGGLRALLRVAGKSYPVSETGQRAWGAGHNPGAALDVSLAPGESTESVLVFDLPVNATDPKLVLTHGFTPGYFVIDESPVFHKPTVMLLR